MQQKGSKKNKAEEKNCIDAALNCGWSAITHREHIHRVSQHLKYKTFIFPALYKFSFLRRHCFCMRNAPIYR